MNWIMETPFRFCTAVTLVVVPLLAFLIYMSDQAAKVQAAYDLQHHCVARGTKQGTVSTGLGIGPKGSLVPVITSTPDQTVYTCDNGEIEIR